ncbi:MAG: hypothetical protein GY768_08705 [Planctomycetaceae bacterium]|nr:hypothetical protein [Planctomycetaceae bacterium]
MDEQRLRKASLEQFILQQLQQNKVNASTKFTNQTLTLQIQIERFQVPTMEVEHAHGFISRFAVFQAARPVTNNPGTHVKSWQVTQFGIDTPKNGQFLTESIILSLEEFLSDWHRACGRNP